MIEDAWTVKDRAGCRRWACQSCGAHVLVAEPADGRCRCCGSTDLRPVATTDAHRPRGAHGRRPAVA